MLFVCQALCFLPVHMFRFSWLAQLRKLARATSIGQFHAHSPKREPKLTNGAVLVGPCTDEVNL